MILVDALIHKTGPRGRKKYCHMTSDSSIFYGTGELHRFAEEIGRNKCWYHMSNNGTPHYDLDDKFRQLAILNGAFVR